MLYYFVVMLANNKETVWGCAKSELGSRVRIFAAGDDWKAVHNRTHNQ